LIALLISFSGSSQSDSTFCFTSDQVKTFLRTKVELNECNNQYNLVVSDLDALTIANTALTVNVVTKQKKLVRTRVIASVVGLIAIIEGLLIILIK
jgi:hypothetical protein